MIPKFIRLILLFFASFFVIACNAQTFLEVSIPGFLSIEKVKLEYYEYIPEKWNGHVIVMSHGSTGGKAASIKTSFRFGISNPIILTNVSFVTSSYLK